MWEKQFQLLVLRALWLLLRASIGLRTRPEEAVSWRIDANRHAAWEGDELFPIRSDKG